MVASGEIKYMLSALFGTHQLNIPSSEFMFLSEFKHSTVCSKHHGVIHLATKLSLPQDCAIG